MSRSVRWLVLSLTALALISIWTSTATAQDPAQQTPVAQTPPVIVTVVVVTPTPSLERKIEALEERTGQLESTEKTIAGLILNNMWPILLVVFVLIFNYPIRTFLDRIASSANKATIEIAGVKYSVPTLNELIVQREILKIGIRIASVDGIHHPQEVKFLDSIASSMTEQLEDLDDNDKLRVFQEAINMAAVEGIIHDIEYSTIKQLAHQFNFPEIKIDNMMVNKCVLYNVDPPSQLRDRCNQRRDELRRQVP